MNDHTHYLYADERGQDITTPAQADDAADGWYNALGVAIYCCLVVLCCWITP